MQSVEKEDQCLINDKTTGAEMWSALIAYKTRRDCTNYDILLTKLQKLELKRGIKVDKWIMDVHTVKRRLSGIGRPSPDNRYAEKLKMFIFNTGPR